MVTWLLCCLLSLSSFSLLMSFFPMFQFVHFSVFSSSKVPMCGTPTDQLSESFRFSGFCFFFHFFSFSHCCWPTLSLSVKVLDKDFPVGAQTSSRNLSTTWHLKISKNLFLSKFTILENCPCMRKRNIIWCGLQRSPYFMRKANLWNKHTFHWEGKYIRLLHCPKNIIATFPETHGTTN